MGGADERYSNARSSAAKARGRVVKHPSTPSSVSAVTVAASLTTHTQTLSPARRLESLTKDMTDRAGRGGDCIWSLAGALRAEGGARVGYTPQFVVDSEELDNNGDAKRGSINFGATVGIHVPLLDMN